MSWPFNLRNPLGKRCLQAIIPGWDSFYGDMIVQEGKFTSVGQKMEFPLDLIGSSPVWLEKIINNHGGGIGSVQSALFVPLNSTSAIRALRTTNDLGIIFPDKKNLTILCIFKPTGDGRPSDGGDPRLYSKDEGSSANDHDLMVGMVGSGDEARTRIRIGSNTVTVATSSTPAIRDDTLALIAGVVQRTSATQVRVKVHYLTVDGYYTSITSIAITGEYNPRTSTDIAIGANAGVDDNTYAGEIIGVWAFDGALQEGDLRTFMANPWQVFKPQRFVIPMTAAAVVEIVGEGPETTVFITDVNTNEIWADGDTSLPITGTGFV